MEETMTYFEVLKTISKESVAFIYRLGYLLPAQQALQEG
jgi:hypothetical protein